MIVAVIPARGGSKRIPRKNIRLFAGEPIIAYSIAAARECGLFDRIIVSTDEDEIAAVARDCGAETPFVRPKELSDDHTGTDPVVAHALDWLAERKEPASIACCIYATAPFLTAQDLRHGYDRLVGMGKQFAFSVCRFSAPVEHAMRLPAAGGVVALYPELIEARSQDLDASYQDAGQFYWGRAEAFLSRLSPYGAHTEPVVLPRWRVCDIDTLEDWAQAELLYAALALREEEKPPVPTHNDALPVSR
jgi:N-acylneuraminate cytidylyltransferase